MVDGCLLVVDATEGPMTQTRFVLSKALQQNLKYQHLRSSYYLIHVVCTVDPLLC